MSRPPSSTSSPEPAGAPASRSRPTRRPRRQARPRRYRLGATEVISDGRVVRRLDGTLAGSAATMDHLVRQVASLAGLRRAVAMASAAPARALRLAGFGRIAAGPRALDLRLHTRPLGNGGASADARP